jgi:CheY-like chemotaxis protein
MGLSRNAGEGAPAEPGHAEPHLHILITDDSRMSAKTLGYMLEVLGHKVQCTYDGTSMLAAARAFRPDVIFLDISLPGINGYELCRQIRHDPQLKDCVLVAQTGWSQEEYRQRSLAAGFDYHLVKPVELTDVKKLLDSFEKRPKAA